MSLIYCPDCKKQISDKADKCPHCGYPIQQELAHLSEKACRDSDAYETVISRYHGRLNLASPLLLTLLILVGINLLFIIIGPATGFFGLLEVGIIAGVLCLILFFVFFGKSSRHYSTNHDVKNDCLYWHKKIHIFIAYDIFGRRYELSPDVTFIVSKAIAVPNELFLRANGLELNLGITKLSTREIQQQLIAYTAIAMANKKD